MITMPSQSIPGHKSKHVRKNSNTLPAKKRNNSRDSLRQKNSSCGSYWFWQEKKWEGKNGVLHYRKTAAVCMNICMHADTHTHTQTRHKEQNPKQHWVYYFKVWFFCCMNDGPDNKVSDLKTLKQERHLDSSRSQQDLLQYSNLKGIKNPQENAFL